MSKVATNKLGSNATIVSKENAALAKQYRSMSEQAHILARPGTYIGSIENADQNMWVYDDATGTICMRNINVNMGIYKLIDEGIVNCSDHVQRMIQSAAIDKKPVTYIKVDIDSTTGTVTLTNDGNGIDIAKHPETGLWIPEMIFGHFRTSSNYDDTEERIVGGTNGLGFKLVLVWSTGGSIETVDHVRGLKYTQQFGANLSSIGAPLIEKVPKSVKPYTRVSFTPDYVRFGVPVGLSADMTAFIKRRAYDIAAVSSGGAKKIAVHFNGALLSIKNFKQYIDLYIGAANTRVYDDEKDNDRWEYAVTMSPTKQFEQISFVNGIATYKGGKHVDYFIGQLTRGLVAYIKDKKKIDVPASAIKEQLMVFVRADIVNPTFDSQTKECMTTVSAKFGSSCSVSKSFIEKVAKMGVMDIACLISEAKDNRVAKKTDGAKVKTIRGIPNFIDANFAGTAQSNECVLVLCEGLSALAGIVSGLSPTDRNTMGIFPLKGKVLNVRGIQKETTDNAEINNIKKILGLETGKDYTTMAEIHAGLRYSKVIFIMDQDLDGSHIKGLIINLFHCKWPSLVKIPGFLSFMNTPILRAKKGLIANSTNSTNVSLFYNEGEYNTWKASIGEPGLKSWNIKYFKGLGTSTSAEFKEYFVNRKIVDFVYDPETSDEIIDLVFNKTRPDDRKVWLGTYEKDSFLDTSNPVVGYKSFFDDEMRHFSTYDNSRSLPDLPDGFKTSIRKIIFAAFKRNLTTEIKVAQLSGYVSEHTAYHHGEASLNGAIVGLAQTYVGSNNINLLMPNGQFGTRLAGGQDSASERYIFTALTPITRVIYPAVDDSSAVIDYINDDGTIVEPHHYLPVIPMILVNGISGIGTGYSCNIPAFNPAQISRYCRAKLLGSGSDSSTEFVPYYEGFKGAISRIDAHKFLVAGVYAKLAEDKIRITELPVGTWTLSYMTFLETLADGSIDKAGKKVAPVLKDVSSISTEVAIDITVQFPKGRLAELEGSVDANGLNGVYKLLKLSTTISTTNMNMFDVDRRLTKYDTVEDIIAAFYGIRMAGYERRKAALDKTLTHQLLRLSNKARYIQGNLDGTIDLRRKSASQVDALLSGQGFDRIDDDYKYLVKMPMDSVTQENVEKIMKEREEAQRELDTLRATSLTQLWIKDLDAFDAEYAKYKTYREKLQNPSATGTKPTKVGIKIKAQTKQTK